MYFPIITDMDRVLPFYVATIGISENERYINRENGIEDYQLLFCTKGSGIVEIDGEKHIINAEKGFLLKRYQPHYYYPEYEPWETNWVTFNGMAVEHFLSPAFNVFEVTNMKKINKMFHDIYQLPKDDKWSERSTVALYRFLLGIKKYIKTTSYLSVYSWQKQLKLVIDFLVENFEKDLELKEMARIIDVTPEHFCRIFKKAYNMRPFAYITMLRIQRAKELLILNPNMTVNDIAENVGYNSTSYFCLLFKKQENLTPIEFRNLHI